MIDISKYRGEGLSWRFEKHGELSICIYNLPDGFQNGKVAYRDLGAVVCQGWREVFGTKKDLQTVEACREFVAKSL